MNAHPAWYAERSGSPTIDKRSLHAMLPSFWTGNKAMAVPARPSRWRLQNSVRAWWVALYRVSLRSSPVAVVNQAIMPGSEG
jgi:hypothetical protein